MTNKTQLAATDASTGAPATNTSNATDRQKALADIECTDILAGHAFALRKLYDEIIRRLKERLTIDPSDEFSSFVNENWYEPINDFVNKKNVSDGENLSRKDLRTIAIAITDYKVASTKMLRAKQTKLPITIHIVRLEKYQKAIFDEILAKGLSNDNKIKAERAKVLIKCYQRILAEIDIYIDAQRDIAHEAIDVTNVLSRKIFSTRLRQARKKKGLTMLDVSVQLQISRSTYNTYELGQRDLPTPTICRLAILLDVSLDWLFGLKD